MGIIQVYLMLTLKRYLPYWMFVFLDDIELSYLGGDYMIPAICLDLLTIVLNYVFIRLRWAETIPWENFLPTKQDPGSSKQGSGFTGMKLFTCNVRI